MFDQSGSPCALSMALVALVLLVLPAAALAQDSTIPVPANAPTALKAPDGSELIVFTAGSRLCIAVQASGDERPVDVSGVGVDSGGLDTVGGCHQLPVLAPPAGDELADIPFGNRRGDLLVTGTAVAAVEAKRNGRVLAHAETVASPLPGAAAELRFAFLPAPKSPADAEAIDEIALLDATSTVRRAHRPSFSEVTPVGQTLTRGGEGGRAWRLSSYRQPVLSPTPLLPERKVTVTCVSVNVHDASDGVCDDERLTTVPVLPVISRTCSPLGTSVAVLVRSRVRRVTLVLGDGSHRTVPLRPVPGDPDGLAAGIALVGPSIAIRRMVVTSAGGRALSSLGLQLAPSAASGCDGFLSFVYSESDTGLRAPGPRVFQAVDRGVQLCVAPNRAPDARNDCGIPPIDVQGSRLVVAPRTDATTITGLVSADVAVVRLALDDGTRRDIPATPIPGYIGQYASTTLLVDAEVAAPRKVGGYELLDARGRVLDDRDDGLMPVLRHRATVLRTPGLPPLRAALISGSDDALPCLAFGALAKVSACTATAAASYTARAFCTPRRIALWGLLSHSTDDVIVQTTDGHEITARKAVLPAAIRRGKGTTAALVVLPAGVGTRRLLVRGKAGGKRDLVLPPAAEQCGYQTNAGMWPGSLRG
jgi:hypothetical protein